MNRNTIDELEIRDTRYEIRDGHAQNLLTKKEYTSTHLKD